MMIPRRAVNTARRGFFMMRLFENRVRFWPWTAQIESLQFFDYVVGAELAVDEVACRTPVREN